MSARESISWSRISAAVAVIIFAFAICKGLVGYVQDARDVVARSSQP